tara:strand:+ start:3909 stop:4664 length:756 start_codon:yes stop_codon:yes gene_type:complete
MKNCLIGYTGFIGKNLIRQKKFTNFYNSKNIHNIDQEKFHTTIICAPHGKKWWANKYPKKDRIITNKLINNLKKLKTNKVIFISTIDIYNHRTNLNENSKIGFSKSNFYGNNRFKIEKFIIKEFNNHHIIRLPALFGNYLKKNILYDLINDNNLENVKLKSKFQWYFIRDLMPDIKKIIKQDIRIINLFTEPISTSEIVKNFFKKKKIYLDKKNQGPIYNLKTIYSKNFEYKRGYIRGKKEILKKMKNYLK